MDDKSPTREFGKRRPAPLPSPPPPSSPPTKRSGHVALLLMGTFAVGGGAYALMGRENCQPPTPGMAAPAQPQTPATCTSRGWSIGGHGGYSGSSRYRFFGSDETSHGSSSGVSESGGISRGGFGSFARAFGFGGG